MWALRHHETGDSPHPACATVFNCCPPCWCSVTRFAFGKRPPSAGLVGLPASQMERFGSTFNRCRTATSPPTLPMLAADASAWRFLVRGVMPQLNLHEVTVADQEGQFRAFSPDNQKGTPRFWGLVGAYSGPFARC